jgi:hypothetical protein
LRAISGASRDCRRHVALFIPAALPVVLFAVLAGTIGDLLDRRRFLLLTRAEERVPVLKPAARRTLPGRAALILALPGAAR